MVDSDEDDLEEDLGERAVQLFLIFDFNSVSFPKSINGTNFLSISPAHVAHTIYVVLYLCGNINLQLVSSHTPDPHLSQVSVVLASSHI